MINTIYTGDCAAIMSEWKTDCIDLTVTSPPYDNLRDYEGYHFDFEAIAAQLWRVTKPGGLVVWVVGDATVNGSETGTSFRQALHFMELGFNLHDTMIYEASKPPKGQNRYRDSFEYMFVFSKDTPIVFNPTKRQIAQSTRKRRSSPRRTFQRQGIKESYKERSLSGGPDDCIIENIWYYRPGEHRTDETGKEHPARFPESLARDHILSWSNPGDLVLDPMCGSGTTLKMAVQTDRNYIGIDISEKYCEIARKRVLVAQPPLFV